MSHSNFLNIASGRTRNAGIGQCVQGLHARSGRTPGGQRRNLTITFQEQDMDPILSSILDHRRKTAQAIKDYNDQQYTTL